MAHGTVKPGEAERRSLHGQPVIHANTALSHVQEAIRMERDPMNKAHLRRAQESLKQVKEPADESVQARMLRRV